MMKKRVIKLNIYGDIPETTVWSVCRSLPESGVTVWDTENGHIAVSKREHVKSDVYDIYRETSMDNE